MWGDQAYRGQSEVIREHAPKAKDFTNRRYRHRGVVDEVEQAKNRTKSRVRAKVEHAIGVIKRVFGFAKVRYRGLEKNANRLFVTCALANLYMVRDICCAAKRRSVSAVRPANRANTPMRHQLPTTPHHRRLRKFPYPSSSR